MYRPNQTCVIYIDNGKTDLYGMPILGTSAKERCAVVKFDIQSQKTAPRAEMSASRTNAVELEAEVIILLGKKTSAGVDDIIEMRGIRIRIMGTHPRFNINGTLDHYEVSCNYWSEA